MDSGLKTTDGHAISLFTDGSGRVIGVYDADNNGITATDKAAIALHIDAATGQVAVAQYVSLQHPDTSSNDEGIALGAGSVSVTVTATDGDGDHVTQSADISQTVVFEDDGPKAVGTASITANVDEDGLAGHNPDAGRPGETGAIGLSATVTGAAGALIALVDFGADGPGAQAFHLASTAVPVDSGLTSQGAHVLIVSDGNTLHGYAEAGNGAGFSDGDREVFQLTVKADGSYVFTLKDQIDHPALDSQAGDNGENQLTSPIDLSSYIVATDGDGDSISLGAGTFLIQVLDDIPVQTSATVAGNVGEDALLLANSNGHSVGNPDGDGLGTVATGSLSSLVSAGADEPGSFSLIQNPTGLPAATSKGEAIVYHVDGTVLTGYVESGTPGLDAGDRKVFTLDVQPNGTYTFTLLDQIDHLPNSPANDDNQKLVLDFTHALQFTDADGDTIAITGETTTTTATTGLSLHPGHYDTYTVGGVTFDGLTFNGTLAHDFNNGAGGDSFNVSGQGVGIADNHIHDNEGFIFSRPGTDAVSFTINGNGSGTISWEAYNGAGVPISGGAGFQTGTMVMPANGSVVTIDPTGTFDHLVIRFDLDSGDKIRADDFLYTSTTTTSGGVFTIGIEDDIPVALNGSATLPTVYEDTLTTGLSTGNPDGGSQPSSITFGASAFASLVSIGADDDATFSFNVATNKASAGVSSGGSAVHFEVGVDAVSGVSDDGRTVFTIKDNDDGTFTFTLLDQVDHAPGSGEDGTLAIDIGSLFKATDFDGDSVNLTGTLNVVVQNDTPLATTATASIMVREDNLNMAVGDGDLSTGITNGPTDTMSTHSDEATFTSAQLQLLVKPGADGPAVFVLNASPTGNVFTVNGEVVTSHGENVRLGAGPAGSVVGYVDGGTHDSVYTAGVDRVVFTLTDNGGGSFKFDLKDHLDHNIFGASGAGDDKTLTLDLTDAFSARDFDGDVAPLGNHAIQVVVENDVPVVGTSAVQLDEDGFAGGNLGGPADFDPATSGPIAVVANLNVNFGADGAGITAFLPASITLPAAGEFTLGTVSATSVFIQQHGVDVLEIDLINAATGSYTVTQLHAIDHPAAGTEDNLQFTIGYQATDFDGDTATGSFTINVNDDTPTIVAPGATVAESTAASFSNTFTSASATGSLGISWGADNANPDTGTHDRSVAFSPLLTGVQAGLTSNGDAITYTLSSDNTVLTATATHNSVIRTVFTVSINDQTNGNYSFDLRDNVDHTAPASGADKNDKALSFGFTATDSDGDSTSSFLTVHVTDDIPVVTSAAETGSVSESPLPSVQSAFGNLNIDWNADDRGASHLEFGRDAGNNLIVPFGLTSGGVDLDYSQRMAANGVDQELVAYKHGETNANPVFIVTLNGIFNPAFAFSLFQPLDHTGGNDASMPLGFTVKAVDGDGDSVTQSFTVNVADDVPTASMNAQVQLDDDALAGNPDGTGDVTPDTAHTSGTLGHTYGADGAGTTLLTGATLPAAGGFSVTSNSGTDLIISQVQNSVVVDVLKVHLADTTSGAYTVTQLHAIDHPAGGDENDVAFTVGYTTTDHDGDTVPGSLTINVDDDTPVAQNYTGAAFAEGSGAHDIGDAVTLLGIGAGADGLQGTLQGLAFTNQGTTGGTLSIDGAGHLIYTAPASVTSASTVTETFSYTVSDKDGDTVTRQVTFGVSDTGITNVAASQNLTVDEDDIVAAGGNAGGPGDDAPVTGGHISYTLGADALSSVALSVASTGLTKLDGTAVSTSWDAASHTLTGYGSSTADVVFTVTLSNITATGADYTVALNQPVSHPVHDDAATGATETAFEDNLGFTVTATVTDADNSTGTTSFTVAIDDDTPLAQNYTGAAFAEGSGAHDIGDAVTLLGIGAGADGLQGTLQGLAFTNQGTTGGMLSIDGAGHLIYTAPANVTSASTVTETFSYTVSDKDGDTVTKQITFGVSDGAAPVAGAPITLALDDQNLADGSTPGATSDQHSITFTPGSDAIASIAFGTDLTALNAANLTWTRESDTQILGKDGSVTVVTLDLSVASNVATVTATLNDNYDAHPGLNADDLVNLGHVGVVATDTDGTQATGTVNVTVSDDVPTAVNDIWASTITGPTVLTGLLANDKFGADGVDTDNAPTPGQVAVTNGAHGTVAYNNDGTFTYTPTGVYVGTDSFTYTIKDGDGDTSTATVTLNVQTNTAPSGGGTVSLTLSEAALDTTLDGTAPADLHASAVTGTNPGSRGETAQANAGITFTTSGEAITVAFANPTDSSWAAPTVSGLASGYSISWAKVGGELVGTLMHGVTDLGPAVYLALSNTIAGANSSLTPVVTATLTDQLQHAAGSGDVTINGLEVVAIDTSGDHVSGMVNLTVVDDAPLAFVPDAIFAEDAAHLSPVVGNLNFADRVGADGAGDVVFNVTETSPVTDLTGQSIFFNGEQVLYHVVDPHTIEGRTSVANGNDLAFTATLDPLNGTWSFTPAGTLYAGNPLNTASVAPSGGNDQVIAFNFPGVQDLLVTANGANTVNTSTNNFGVGSGQSIAGGETVRFDFVTNASTSGTTRTFDSYYEVSSFTTSITKTNQEPIMAIRAVNADGDANFVGDGGDTTAAGILVFVTNAGGSLTPTVTYAGGIATVTGLEEGDIIKVVATTDAFSAIEFTGVDNPATKQSDNFKLGPAQFTTTNEASPFNVAIPVVGTDGDGDSIAGTVNASLSPDPATLEGTSGGDALVATTVIHNLFGLDGNDTLTGLDGHSNLLAGGRGDDILHGGSGADQLHGGSGTDQLFGGGGNDTLVGGAGADTMTGGAGADTITIGAGDSSPTIGGSGDAGTISGYDIITDFVAGTDKLTLPGTLVAATGGNVNGGNSTLTIGGDTVQSHSVTNGVASFFGTDSFTAPLAVTSTAGLAAVVQYLTLTDIGSAGATLAFTATIAAISHTFVYTQAGADAGVGSLVDLQGVTITNLDTLIGGSVDPIILDLNHDGFAFSDVNHGVQFDMNGDGTKEQLAWNTSHDGMLAMDLNHDGKIDDGTELFTPNFDEGHFASGAAALASLDSNHDGVIDHNDAAFSSLLIWKDTNANGTSEAGELSHLADNGIVSISTAANPAVGEIDGQTVTGNGTFQMADGTTGNYIEVELDTSLVAPAQPTVASDGTKTFAIGSLEVTDLIADFHDGANGDKIDLTALLKGLAGVTDLEAGGFVEIAQSSANAANAEVKVDTNGGGDNYHTVAVLENYTFHSAAEAVKILYDDSHGTKQDVA
ncbi:DUF5801 domain-containing protein [Mesorhizobium sp. CA13]|nr:DUF5801 domain-containing protein [Mesorhizobium sp. CA13]